MKVNNDAHKYGMYKCLCHQTSHVDASHHARTPIKSFYENEKGRKVSSKRVKKSNSTVGKQSRTPKG